MKPVVIVLGLGAAALGGYMYFSSMQGTETAANQAEAPQAAEPESGTVAEAAEEAVGEAVQAAGEAAEAAAEAVGTAAEAAEEVVQEAVEAAQTAASAAADAASGAADAVTGAATAAGDQAAGQAADAAEAVNSAADSSAAAAADGSEQMALLLTPGGFDHDKVIKMIGESDLDPARKTLLSSAVTQAKDDPELLKAALEQVKSALGL